MQHFGARGQWCAWVLETPPATLCSQVTPLTPRALLSTIANVLSDLEFVCCGKKMSEYFWRKHNQELNIS